MAGLMVRGAGVASEVAGAGESGVMGAESREQGARSREREAMSGSCSGGRVGRKEARDTRATTEVLTQGHGNSSGNSHSLIRSSERSYF